MGNIVQHHGFRKRHTLQQSARPLKDRSTGRTLEELKPLVPSGEYSLEFVRQSTFMYRGKTPKVSLTFRIVDPGQFQGLELQRYYNVRKLRGKTGKGGKFTAKDSGSFLNEYVTLFPNELRRDSRLDRISFKPFRHKNIRGLVGTSIRNPEGEDRPNILHYSRIEKLIEVVK